MAKALQKSTKITIYLDNNILYYSLFNLLYSFKKELKVN